VFPRLRAWCITLMLRSQVLVRYPEFCRGLASIYGPKTVPPKWLHLPDHQSPAFRLGLYGLHPPWCERTFDCPPTSSRDVPRFLYNGEPLQRETKQDGSSQNCTEFFRVRAGGFTGIAQDPGSATRGRQEGLLAPCSPTNGACRIRTDPSSLSVRMYSYQSIR